MTVSNERELWEAFRNQEPTIVIDDMTMRASLIKRIQIINSAWFMILFFTLCIAALGFVAGWLNEGAKINDKVVLSSFGASIPGLLCTVLAILVKKGKIGSFAKELAKYQVKDEYGVLTLTRK